MNYNQCQSKSNFFERNKAFFLNVLERIETKNKYDASSSIQFENIKTVLTQSREFWQNSVKSVREIND